METKVCRICGRELPLNEFPLSRCGNHASVCRECRTATLRENKAAKRAQMGGGKTAPFSDPDFDGKQPVEVIQLMSRAKRWLETRGYSITLKGTYTQVKEVKF